MGAFTDEADGRVAPSGILAAALLDEEGTVRGWSDGAEELLGHTAEEVCGHSVWTLLDDSSDGTRGASSRAGIPRDGHARVRHQSGSTIDVTVRVTRLKPSSGFLVLAAPIPAVADQLQGAALLRALLSQDRIGIVLHDTELKVVRTNIDSGLFGGPPLPPGSRLAETVSAEDAEDAEAALRQVLKTGAPVAGREQRMRSPLVPEREWTLLMSAFRLEDEQGHPTGVAATLIDVTDRQRAHRHLNLLHDASLRIGGSLDISRTAQELADVLVPALGDLAAVTFAEAVLEGDEPPKTSGGGELHLRRIAVASATGQWPADLLAPGTAVPTLPDMPALRSIQQGRTVVLDRDEAIASLGDPRLVRLWVPEDGHSMALAPLFARGLLLGDVEVWRTRRPEPFDAEEARLLTEISSRAALSVDNARRYTREHRANAALQQRLLPPALAETTATETSGIYLPAGGGAEISGDWFDVIPLPSLRVAFVVGDVAGHGLQATATMGRLRTAVQTLADLEPAPDDLLTHLDDFVQRLAAEAPHGLGYTVGATCLYAVYDPVTCRCTLASAGHLPPVVVLPDGTTRVVAISPGPPLGVGGAPFETTTIDLEPGSVLALYTKGLVYRADGYDIEAGTRWLTDGLADLCRSELALNDAGQALLSRLEDRPPREDIALLLARTRALPPESTAVWEFPADPAVVADAREVTARQLAAWGLDDLLFSTELIVSELVTNAIRYAGGPVGLRLICDNVLICEVTDPSNTQPRLRRARWTDEGGRGLFLVAQLTSRWGSRYGQQGKTIWAEQPLGSPVGGLVPK